MVECILVNLLDSLDSAPCPLPVVLYLCLLLPVISMSSVACNLYVLDMNVMSCYCVLHFLGHLINCIALVFQFTSGLYLTNQLFPKNMFMLFKSMTTMSILFICLLISSSSGTNLVTFPFLIPSVLKTLNLFISSVFICSFFTSCLSILV